MAWVKCNEATTLALAGCDCPLSRGERLRLGLHRLFCAPCRMYKRQLAQLRGFLARVDEPAPPAAHVLPEEARARLAARLRAARDAER